MQGSENRDIETTLLEASTPQNPTILRAPAETIEAVSHPITVHQLKNKTAHGHTHAAWRANNPGFQGMGKTANEAKLALLRAELESEKKLNGDAINGDFYPPGTNPPDPADPAGVH